MMNLRKALTAALVALAALAALALPAAASASVWLHEGEPLEKAVELPLTGGEAIEVEGGLLVCNGTSATMTAEVGSTALISAYGIEAGGCVGLGSLEGCEVTAATPSGTPWSVTVNTADLTVSEFAVTYSFEGCSTHKLELSFPELTLTPEEEPSAIRYFRFSRTGTAVLDEKEITVEDAGTLQLPEEDFGTYGIG